MAKKPANLIYGVDEKPAFWEMLILGIQHICLIAIGLILPVVIVREIGGTTVQAVHLVSVSMVAGGIGVIVQALKKGPLGSGYLCPQLCGPSFLSASLLAGKTGGLSLIFGITAVAGVFEALLSRIIHRLRFLFPAEVTGLIVAMVGITVIRLAASYFMGLTESDQIVEARELFVSFLTLSLMVGLNIWSKGKLRLFCIIIGMIAGYLASYAVGILTMMNMAEMTERPWFAFPFAFHPGWSFSFTLIIPVLVATLCSTLKSVGDLTTCQKINDAEWKRPDMNNIGKGILADAAGCLSAGILGGMGQSTSSSNIGLSIATGATSRVIAYVIGGLLVVLAFFPKIAGVFAIMPIPVMGATLIFALTFMVVAGFQIIMSRMIDARKTFVVGISLIFGLAVDIVPEPFADLHPWIQPIFSSSLSAATVVAVCLNLIFRIGISSKVRLELVPGMDYADKIFTFMERQGGLWGARSEVIYRAMAAMNEFMEAAAAHELARAKVSMTVSFDEYNLDVEVCYQGKPMIFPMERPDKHALRSDPEAAVQLAGFLIRQYVDRVKAEDDGELCIIKMHFDH